MSTNPNPKAFLQAYQKKVQPCCLLKSCGKNLDTKEKLIEEDIYAFYKKRLLSLNERDMFAKDRICKCDPDEPYTYCVVTQRSIPEQKKHEIARENYLRTKWQLDHTSHEHKQQSKKAREVIELDKPSGGGKVPLKPASPTCSRETFYIPTRKLMDLKKPNSGIFINQKKEDVPGGELPFQDYNPRIIQNRLDTGHCGQFDVDRNQEGKYTWFENVASAQGDGNLSTKGNRRNRLRNK